MYPDNDNTRFTHVNLCKLCPLKFLEWHSNERIREGSPQSSRRYTFLQQLQDLDAPLFSSICPLASKEAHDMVFFPMGVSTVSIWRFISASCVRFAMLAWKMRPTEPSIPSTTACR